MKRLGGGGESLVFEGVLPQVSQEQKCTNYVTFALLASLFLSVKWRTLLSACFTSLLTVY
jgi:hypothetical protein